MVTAGAYPLWQELAVSEGPADVAAGDDDRR